MPQHRWREIVTVALLGAMAISEAVQAAPAFSNGGSQYWIAFDPNGRTLGNVQFLTKRILVLNTSNAPNAFTIFYEPQHTKFCAATLEPGAMTTCGQMSTPAMVGGYFQVVAAEPVLVGGSSDTPFMNFTQDAQGNFGADPSHGTVISVPFAWQQGCPPPVTGCPDGPTAVGPTGVTTGRLQQMR
jgi:hypothetical protein